MKIKRIALVGGSGFVGRHLTRHLQNRGYACRVITRHPHRHRDLASFCEVVAANPYDHESLVGALRGCDAVINLAGILNSDRKMRTFRRVHVELVENIVASCRTAGVRRLLHMSALNASESQNKSSYLHTKGKGENRVHTLSAGTVRVTSFRPSVIFGPGDSFINRFAQLLRIPGPMPLACHEATFAPVYIGDVVKAFVNALEDKNTWGKRYELCGPRTFTLRQIVEYIIRHKGMKKPVIGLGDGLSRLQAHILGKVPGKPFTMDNYRSLQVPSICAEDGLAELGIEATDMDAIVPRMLGSKR